MELFKNDVDAGVLSLRTTDLLRNEKVQDQSVLDVGLNVWILMHHLHLS